MTETATLATAVQLARQVAHWTGAAARLERVEDLADADAWAALERDCGVALRENLEASQRLLMADADRLIGHLRRSGDASDMTRLSGEVVAFRRRYLRTETLHDFYGDCVRARTNRRMAALLRACEKLSGLSMVRILAPLGRKAPPVLCYADAGLGASILKSGLRLWDGRTASGVAAIKIARQNLLRPTNAIHETGHQVAHILGWARDLSRAIEAALPGERATIWAGWASEMVADAFAFAHTGFASVAGLHDVVAGGPAFVFRHAPGDPHPISYLRVLLGVEMCRRSYGSGPWNDMEAAWKALHPLMLAPRGTAALIGALRGDLPRVAELLVDAPMAAFRDRTLSSLVDPTEVSPASLARIQRTAGSALFTKRHWLRENPIGTLALGGLRLAVDPAASAAITAQQESWMLRLGGDPELADQVMLNAAPIAA